MTYAARFDWDLLMEQAYQFILHILAGDQVYSGADVV